MTVARDLAAEGRQEIIEVTETYLLYPLHKETLAATADSQLYFTMKAAVAAAQGAQDQMVNQDRVLADQAQAQEVFIQDIQAGRLLLAAVAAAEMLHRLEAQAGLAVAGLAAHQVTHQAVQELMVSAAAEAAALTDQVFTVVTVDQVLL